MDQFSRTALLIGEEAVNRLHRARVAVFGLGGVGGSAAEVLVRRIRDGRTITPGEFIPILETGNSICMLDFYIFEQVCKDIRKWLDEGIEPVRISTNFSRRNLANPDFPDNIKKLLTAYDIPKEDIEIEV